jgi:hypothetical protein
MRTIRTFKKLCGDDGLSRTVLVTTFWKGVTEEEGRQREEELLTRANLWKFIRERGGKAFQYHQTKKSAEQVVDYIIKAKLGKAALTIQKDMVDRGMKLGETEAGVEVSERMAQLQQSYEKEIQRLKAELEEAIRQKDDDIQQMKDMLEQETEALQQRVEQLEHDRGLLELSNEGLGTRLKVAYRVLRKKF